MSRNDCEAVLHLHRSFRPRRRTGRGFLTGTVFLDAAMLLSAFVLATTPFVLKPGIAIDLPVASKTSGIRFNDMVLNITTEGRFFFDDSLITPDQLETALTEAQQRRPESALILQADRSTSQATVTKIYEAAERAGFRQIFIATQHAAPEAPLP